MKTYLGRLFAIWICALSYPLDAQEPFLLRKDIAVAQQSGAGATGGPTVVGDFNGDGRPDIGVCGAPGLRVLLNSGSANFRPPRPMLTECAAIAGDFNSDGRLDLVSALHLFLGRGDGTFLQPRIIGPGGVSPRAVVSGDFNGDRIPDMVFYTGSISWDEDDAVPTVIHVMLGAGDGTFSQTQRIENPIAGLLGTAIADYFDRDGHADLAVTDGDGGILVFLGKGEGSFQAPIRTVTGENGSQLLAGDFNGDGLRDVASASSIALGKGDGAFSSPVRHTASDIRNEYGLPLALIQSAAADFNGDGHLDLAGVPFSLPPFQREVWVLPGKGDGTLQAPVRYAVGLFPHGVSLADIDADGRPDLVASGPLSNSVSLLLSRPAHAALHRAVSAASGLAIVAPESLATLFARGLAAGAEHAQSSWPLGLGGVSLEVRDSSGATQLAPLLYVSPNQVNFQVPAGVALGEVTLSIIDERGSRVVGSVQVSAVAPGLFAAFSMFSPLPLAAATAIRVEPDGAHTILPLIECTPENFCFPVQLPVPSPQPIYVSLFGTGFRNATASEVTCTANGEPLTIQYAGPQATPGVDQINVLAPFGRRDLGTVVCAVDGVVANPVWL